jgi:hypothetical protein
MGRMLVNSKKNICRDEFQLSEMLVESSLASAVGFKRSALLTYVDLRFGANLALAFLA